MAKDPVDPTLEVPELNTRLPLTPALPALAVLIVNSPLVVSMPWALVSPMAPPVSTVLSPDASDT
jgi:hypothetical protein